MERCWQAGRSAGAPLCRYALLADLEAPQISIVQPAEGAVVGSRPEIRGAVRDQGAGIGREKDLELELNGRPLIAEYDPEAGRVYGHLAEDCRRVYTA